MQRILTCHEDKCAIESANDEGLLLLEVLCDIPACRCTCPFASSGLRLLACSARNFDSSNTPAPHGDAISDVLLSKDDILDVLVLSTRWPDSGKAFVPMGGM